MSINYNWFEKWVLIPLFPLYKTVKANKKLFKDIEELKQLERLKPEDNDKYYMKDYIKLTIENANIFFDKTLEKKKSLEDKAKVNVFGATIAVTLVTGLYKAFLDLSSNGTVAWVKIFLFLLAMYTLIQMILAGLSSIKVLNDIIQQYELFPDDFNLSEDKKLDLIALNTEINLNYNYIRNNFLSSSYGSMRNSLVGLFLLFFLLTIPLPYINSNKKEETKIYDQIISIEKKQTEIIEEISKLKVIQASHSKKVEEIDKISKMEQALSELNQEVNKIKK